MSRRVLVIGFGNPGRLDDGLGPAVAKKLEEVVLSGVTVDSNYQLSVEDAAPVSEADLLILVDASVNGCEPFEFYEIFPSQNELSFSSHSVKPEGLLTLAENLFGKCPEAYLLTIRGYEFNEFGERLSEQARKNLEKACAFLKNLLLDIVNAEVDLKQYCTLKGKALGDSP